MTKGKSQSSKREYALAIDTTEANTGIGLGGPGLHKIRTWVSYRNQSKELLPNIDRLLRSNKIKPKQLRQVAANLGPGSFTGLRIGISIANAFGYALNIPVAGKSGLTGIARQRIETLLKLKPRSNKFKPALPQYGRPARITQPKPKRYC